MKKLDKFSWFLPYEVFIAQNTGMFLSNWAPEHEFSKFHLKILLSPFILIEFSQKLGNGRYPGAGSVSFNPELSFYWLILQLRSHDCSKFGCLVWDSATLNYTRFDLRSCTNMPGFKWSVRIHEWGKKPASNCTRISEEVWKKQKWRSERARDQKLETLDNIPVFKIGELKGMSFVNFVFSVTLCMLYVNPYYFPLCYITKRSHYLKLWIFALNFANSEWICWRL